METMMTITKTLALATALSLMTLGSGAFAGEGSPDLSGHYPSVNESDPGGSNYGSNVGTRFSEPYYTAPRYTAPREAYGRAYGPSDENTGAVVRQNRYGEQYDESE
jgi:hypothetical protein